MHFEVVMTTLRSLQHNNNYNDNKNNKRGRVDSRLTSALCRTRALVWLMEKLREKPLASTATSTLKELE